MNVVREIERMNKAELSRAGPGGGGSWHDQYKDSAYIFVGGLPNELTEGDVVTIFSQFGEPVDVNLPRDKQTGKTRGFGFLMYEDQKSTVLAVDNLNGAKVLGRTLRVDHVNKYKHLEKGDDGKYKEADMETMNARPELFMNQNAATDTESEEEDDLLDGIDPDDPMAAYLISQRKEERALAIQNGTHKKKSKKTKKSGESKEERRARKEEKRLRKLQKGSSKKDGPSDRRDRSRSPVRERRRREYSEDEEKLPRRRSRSREPERRRRDEVECRPDDRHMSRPASPDNNRQRRRSYSDEEDDDRRRPRRTDDSRHRYGEQIRRRD